MKQFNGYEEAKKSAQYEGGASLPVDSYVCKVLDVKYTPGKDGNSDMIALRYDIVEGEYKDFFRKQYDANTSEDKKWKGKTNVWVPKDDGSEKDGWTKNAFARWTNNFEKSNKGYVWDWDESKWKDKLIGIVYGQTGTVIDGKEVVYTEAHFPISVDEARDHNFREPKLKKKNGYTGTQNNSSSMDDFVAPPKGAAEEIPF